MKLFAWRDYKKRELLQGEAALLESENALDEVHAVTQRAKTVAKKLSESRQENHYAERLRFAYEAGKR